jgi:hypothetical protein
MKKIKAFLIATGVSVALATGISSCVTDKCKDVVCQNDGICVEGTCDCPAGTSGTFCDVLDRAALLNASGIATYRVVETCFATGAADYTVDFSASGTSLDKILVNDFGGYPSADGVALTVSGSTVTIASQTVSGYTVSGSGTISGSTITMNYTVTAGGLTETCSGTWTKL